MLKQIPEEVVIDIIRLVWKLEITSGSDTFPTLLPLSQVSTPHPNNRSTNEQKS
jgi:hypothetical protein